MSDKKKSECRCPYCDTPVLEDLCQPCGVQVTLCPECGKPLPKDSKECPECGASGDQNQGG
ncbi:MAG: zinc-ribbon domain-containing protein [candidate division WOR-3 bacterium]|nr:MAG: zinc-ribbon domain-containing protein [candidate division WOR-3 bacterium]